MLTNNHAPALRARLRNPPNAVPDRGINLRCGRLPGWRPALGPKPEPAPKKRLGQASEAATLPAPRRCQPSLNDPCDSWAFLFEREWSAYAKESTVELREILGVVAARYAVPIDALISHSRKAKVVRPRMLVAYLARSLTRLSTSQLGRGLGGRNHTTIVYSHKKIAHQRALDPDVDRELTELIAELRQERRHKWAGPKAHATNPRTRTAERRQTQSPASGTMAS